MVTSPTPYGLLFPKIGGSQPQYKTAIAIIYGLQIWPVHSQGPSKQKPIKNFGKKERGHTRDCPNFWSTPIISGTGKAMNFKFYMHILNMDRNKSLLQILEKVAMGVYSGT